LAVGPKIGDERIRNSAEPFAPRLFGRDRVTRDSQNLAVQSFEFVHEGFQRRNLTVSGRGKGERMKCQHDIFFAAISAQFYVNAFDVGFGQDAAQFEVRGDVANFDFGFGHNLLRD
jgi:hypothetical protein